MGYDKNDVSVGKPHCLIWHEKIEQRMLSLILMMKGVLGRLSEFYINEGRIIEEEIRQLEEQQDFHQQPNEQRSSNDNKK